MADNWGACEKCRKIVPAKHEHRDGKVYIVKDCPDCGRTEAMISSDAATWQRKREIWRFDPAAAGVCNFDCAACGHEHHPAMVFLNITNRCNMNCPICIANIPGMGFEFHPRLEYFEHVLDGLAEMKPRPVVNLFGGEPTVREDMFEIIKMAQARKIKVGIVTNGLRLADPEFCKKVCDSGARVLFAFDGNHPDIYERLRKNRAAYDKKIQGLENLKKYTDPTKKRHTIMCCIARGVNDKYMRELIDFCHDNRSYIQFLHMIPLTETWKEGEFENLASTTIEDAEQIVGEAFPGERVEFLSAGLGRRFEKLLKFFGSPRLRFGGVHPNCESVTFFYSDGTRYRPISSCFKRPITDLVDEAVARVDAIADKLNRLDPDKWLQRWWGRWLGIWHFSRLAWNSIRLREVTKGNTFLTTLRILGGLLIGKSFRDQIQKHTHLTDMLYMVILPFEEYHSIESQRLHTCAAGFAFEDPDTGRVRTIPVCAWSLYRDDIERKIAAKYGEPRSRAVPQSTPGAEHTA